jgi:hypothetical protein
MAEGNPAGAKAALGTSGRIRGVPRGANGRGRAPGPSRGRVLTLVLLSPEASLSASTDTSSGTATTERRLSRPSASGGPSVVEAPAAPSSSSTPDGERLPDRETSPAGQPAAAKTATAAAAQALATSISGSPAISVGGATTTSEGAPVANAAAQAPAILDPQSIPEKSTNAASPTTDGESITASTASARQDPQDRHAATSKSVHSAVGDTTAAALHLSHGAPSRLIVPVSHKNAVDAATVSAPNAANGEHAAPDTAQSSAPSVERPQSQPPGDATVVKSKAAGTTGAADHSSGLDGNLHRPDGPLPQCGPSVNPAGLPDAVTAENARGDSAAPAGAATASAEATAGAATTCAAPDKALSAAASPAIPPAPYQSPPGKGVNGVPSLPAAEAAPAAASIDRAVAQQDGKTATPTPPADAAAPAEWWVRGYANEHEFFFYNQKSRETFGAMPDAGLLSATVRPGDTEAHFVLVPDRAQFFNLTTGERVPVPKPRRAWLRGRYGSGVTVTFFYNRETKESHGAPVPHSCVPQHNPIDREEHWECVGEADRKPVFVNKLLPGSPLPAPLPYYRTQPRLWLRGRNDKGVTTFFYNRSTHESCGAPVPPGVVAQCDPYHSDEFWELWFETDGNKNKHYFFVNKLLPDLGRQPLLTPYHNPQQRPRQEDWLRGRNNKGVTTFFYNRTTQESYGAPVPPGVVAQCNRSDPEEYWQKRMSRNMTYFVNECDELKSLGSQEAPKPYRKTQLCVWLRGRDAKNATTFFYNKLTKESYGGPVPLEVAAQQSTGDAEECWEKRVNGNKIYFVNDELVALLRSQSAPMPYFEKQPSVALQAPAADAASSVVRPPESQDAPSARAVANGAPQVRGREQVTLPKVFS